MPFTDPLNMPDPSGKEPVSKDHNVQRDKVHAFDKLFHRSFAQEVLTYVKIMLETAIGFLQTRSPEKSFYAGLVASGELINSQLSDETRDFFDISSDSFSYDTTGTIYNKAGYSVNKITLYGKTESNALNLKDADDNALEEVLLYIKTQVPPLPVAAISLDNCSLSVTGWQTLIEFINQNELHSLTVIDTEIPAAEGKALGKLLQKQVVLNR